jgi:hypothetical protein
MGSVEAEPDFLSVGARFLGQIQAGIPPVTAGILSLGGPPRWVDFWSGYISTVARKLPA